MPPLSTTHLAGSGAEPKGPLNSSLQVRTQVGFEVDDFEEDCSCELTGRHPATSANAARKGSLTLIFRNEFIAFVMFRLKVNLISDSSSINPRI